MIIKKILTKNAQAMVEYVIIVATFLVVAFVVQVSLSNSVKKLFVFIAKFLTSEGP